MENDLKRHFKENKTKKTEREAWRKEIWDKEEDSNIKQMAHQVAEDGEDKEKESYWRRKKIFKKRTKRSTLKVQRRARRKILRRGKQEKEERKIEKTVQELRSQNANEPAPSATWCWWEVICTKIKRWQQPQVWTQAPQSVTEHGLGGELLRSRTIW